VVSALNGGVLLRFAVGWVDDVRVVRGALIGRGDGPDRSIEQAGRLPKSVPAAVSLTRLERKRKLPRCFDGENPFQ
jgi:hypothetical protein